jgi:hypothetical protein
MKVHTVLLVTAVFYGGCSTQVSPLTQKVCAEKGMESSDCMLAQQIDKQNARGQNMAAGAAMGCVLTGPFCLFGVGPLIGGVIGANQ